MCMTADCPTCGKTTWMGCGSHIARAMKPVPKDEWCTCLPTVTFEGAEYPPKLE
jgi:hypothetical protein